LECAGCGATYPIVAGVPVMIADAVLLHLPPPAPAAIDSVIAYFSLPDDAETRARAAAILGRAPLFGAETIRTEAVQFANRMESTQRERGGASAAEAPDTSVAVRPSLVARWRHRLRPRRRDAKADEMLARTAYRIGRTYVPRRIQAGAQISANIRVRNTGPAPLRSDGPVPAYLSYWWHDGEGKIVDREGLRTRLPLPLKPGQEIAIPQRILAPTTPGDYRLEIKLVCEGLAWLEEGGKMLPIEIGREAPSAPLGPAWRSIGEDALDYKADHDEGAEFLKHWLEARGDARKRVLEIGGNAHPMVAALDVERTVVDVDLQGLQCGVLWQERTGFRIANVCADAAALPFADGFFDAITMFASLHHFENPTGLLAHLKTKIKPGGFIAVMSEPVGHYDPDHLPEEFRREFERGVNEQSFTLDEYARMFADAGLIVADAPLRRGSLRACLTIPPDSATEP
jgi:SAM-dependent methyltransferase